MDSLFESLIGAAFVALLVIGGAYAWNNSFGSDTYTLYYYPDAPDLGRFEKIGVSSIEECRDIASSYSIRDARPNYDYECGINCTSDPNFLVDRCKDTVQ